MVRRANTWPIGAHLRATKPSHSSGRCRDPRGRTGGARGSPASAVPRMWCAFRFQVPMVSELKLAVGMPRARCSMNTQTTNKQKRTHSTHARISLRANTNVALTAASSRMHAPRARTLTQACILQGRHWQVCGAGAGALEDVVRRNQGRRHGVLFAARFYTVFMATAYRLIIAGRNLIISDCSR